MTSEIRHTSGKNKEIGLFTQFYQKHFFYFTGNVFDLFNTVIYQKRFFLFYRKRFWFIFHSIFSGNFGFFALLYTLFYRKRFWFNLHSNLPQTIFLPETILIYFLQYFFRKRWVFALFYTVFYRKRFCFTLQDILPETILLCFTQYFTGNDFVLFYIVFYQKCFLFYTVMFFVLHGILPEAFLIYFTQYFIGNVLSADLFPRQKTSNSLFDQNC